MKRLRCQSIFFMFFFPVIILGHPYEMTLANGLKVLVVEDHRAPLVMNSIWYRVGADYEVEGQDGLSHMLEHMMFRGTPNLEKKLNALGAETNALTSSDFTVYYEVANKKYLPALMALEANRLQHLQLKKEDFEQEKKVVMEERRMRTDDSPVALANEYLWTTAFPSVRYRKPTIGWMNHIAQYDLQDAKNWYDNWYQPNNAFLFISGDVDHQKVFAWAKTYFSHIPAKKLPTLKSQTEIEPIAEHHIHLDLPGKNRYLLMGYRVPAAGTAHNLKEVYGLALLSQLLGQGSSSLLYEQLLNQDESVSEIESAYNSPFFLHDALFTVVAVPADKTNSEALEENIKAMIARVKKSDFSEQALNRAKNKLIADLTYEKDNVETDLLAQGQFEIAHQPILTVEDSSVLIHGLTKEEIEKLAQKYLVNNRLTVVTVGKKSKGDSV